MGGGTVNNSNKTWYVLVSAMYNNEQIRKSVESHGDPDAHTLCAPPPLNYHGIH